MSIKVMSWVWENSPTVGADRLVLLAIADAANDAGRDAYPGMSTIAKKANVDKRTAQRSVRALAAAGALTVAENAGPRGTHRYAVIMGRQDTIPGVSPPVVRDHRSHTTRRDATVASDPRRGDEMPPEPSLTKDQKTTSSGGQRKPKPPDVVWDALVAACGIDSSQLTKTGRGAMNRAVSELRAVAATPQQIGERAYAYRRTYPNTTLTPAALVKHWGQLNGHKPPTAPYHQEWPT